MATVSEAPRESVPEEQRLLLRGVDWDSYRKISDALTGRHVRLTYDRGNLEFMTISSTHGNYSWLIGRFVTVLTEEVNLPVKGFSDMTCDREDLERGIEPDECFYIANEPLIRSKESIDLEADPPPDLAVEVDVSRSSRTRLPVYAALRVPEVWRFDGAKLLIHQLQADGQYAIVERSRFFPFLSGADLVRFIAQRTQVDENSLMRSFREWIREQIRTSEKQP